MSTTAKVAIGVAGLAIVYFVLRARAQAQNSYTTGSAPAPAPTGFGDAAPPSAATYGTYAPTTGTRSGRGAF